MDVLKNALHFAVDCTRVQPIRGKLRPRVLTRNDFNEHIKYVNGKRTVVKLGFVIRNNIIKCYAWITSVKTYL